MSFSVRFYCDYTYHDGSTCIHTTEVFLLPEDFSIETARARVHERDEWSASYSGDSDYCSDHTE